MFRVLIMEVTIWGCRFHHSDNHGSLHCLRNMVCAPGLNSVLTWAWSKGFPSSVPLPHAKFFVTDFIPSHWAETSREYFCEGWETQVKCYLDDWATVSTFFLLKSSYAGFFGFFYFTVKLCQGQSLKYPFSLFVNGRCVECEFKRLVERLWGLLILNRKRPHGKDIVFMSLFDRLGQWISVFLMLRTFNRAHLW